MSWLVWLIFLVITALIFVLANIFHFKPEVMMAGAALFMAIDAKYGKEE